jgi:anti-sigma factor RsiW
VTCREVADFLMDYTNGELPRSERATFERHLRVCPNCREYLALYVATIELSRRACADEQRSAATAGVPEELVAAILAARPARDSAR